MIETILIIIAITALIIASITDIKTREVPDWLNYGLIISGLGLRLIYSTITADWMFFIYSVSGALLFLLLAYLMFYTAQWGGGDSKMLIGLGAMIGFDFSYSGMLVALITNILLVGAIYGLLWSLILVIFNSKKFMVEAKRLLTNKYMVISRRVLLVLLIFSFTYIMIMKDFFLGLILVSMVATPLFVLYLWIFIKAVENACMLKYITPEKLTEGDWIAKEIKVDGKYICGPRDLGIEKKQIERLIKLKEEGKVDKVLIKTGIPFIPSFLIAYIISLLYGNLLVRIVY